MMITDLKTYRKIFEEKESTVDLVIVDVQPKFKKFITNTYLLELKDYAEKFQRVFQIYDVIDGEDNPYYFPNQIEAYEKAYGGELLQDDIYYYFNNPHVIEELENKFENNSFQPGDKYQMSGGDYFIYVGDQHEWFICSEELCILFENFAKQKRKITLVGGAQNECLSDIYISMIAFDVDVTINSQYVYSYHSNPFNEMDPHIKLDRYLNEIEEEEIDESKNTIEDDLEEIPDDLEIDSIVDIFTDMDEVLEKYGDINMYGDIEQYIERRVDLETTNLNRRHVTRNDIIYVVVLLKARNSSAAHNIGEMGVVQCRVLKTYYGLNRLKQLHRKGEIIIK